MHRTGPRGLGRSYLDGFRAALASDADFVCQMDADLSHDPKFLPAIDRGADGDADLVIGSRYLPGGGVENWPLHRVMLSGFANSYIRTVTGLRVRDCTSGYPLLAPRRRWRGSARRDRVGRLLVSRRGDVSGRGGRLAHRRGADRLRRAPAGRVEAVLVGAGRIAA